MACRLNPCSLNTIHYHHRLSERVSPMKQHMFLVVGIKDYETFTEEEDRLLLSE